MRLGFGFLGALVLSASPLLSERGGDDGGSCIVDDVEEYYAVALTESYDTRRHAQEIAKALYVGPLMREGDEGGLRNLTDLVKREKLEVRELQNIVAGHLYGSSDEFRERLQDLEGSHPTPGEAGMVLVKSIYEAFGYDEASPAEEDFDACLVLARKADVVVTKVVLEYLERGDLGRKR